MTGTTTARSSCSVLALVLFQAFRPNWTLPSVAVVAPNRPALCNHFSTARMSTVPALVCPVLMNEYTSLAPLLPA